MRLPPANIMYLLFRKYYSSATKVGFIGLGKMGSPMCKRLIDNKYNLIVYDKELEASKKFERIATVAPSLDAFHDCDVVFTMLPDSKSTSEAIFSKDGLVKCLKKNSVIVNSGTIGITETVEIFEKIGAKFKFIDAPVSGGTRGAENGTLTFMIGGSSDVITNLDSILKCMGKKVFFLGDVGKGQAAKICNNLLLAINMMGACESYTLADKLGLNLKSFDELVNVSSGRSWVTECNNPVPGLNQATPATDNYLTGFASDLLLKDIQLALKALPNNSIDLPALKLAETYYQQMIRKDINSKSKDMSYLFQFITTSKSSP